MKKRIETSLKKTHVKRNCLIAAVILSASLWSCEETGTDIPVVTPLGTSECHTATDMLSVKEFATDSLAISWPDEEGPMTVTHYNMILDCGEPHITTRVERAGQVVTVVEEVGEQGLTNCICLYDNSFQIDLLPERPFTLVVQVESLYCGNAETHTVYEHTFE